MTFIWIVTNKIFNFQTLTQITCFDFLCILPEIYLLIMCLILLIVISFFGKNTIKDVFFHGFYTKDWIYNISIGTLYIVLIFLSIQCKFFLDKSFLLFLTYTITDFYTLFIKIIIISVMCFLLNIAKSEKTNLTWDARLEYPLVLLFLTLFLMILISSYNFITVFFGIVGLSLTLYILLLNDAINHSTKEAGIKYFYLSVISTSFLISGIFLLYLIFNSTGFISIIWLIYNWKLNMYFEPNKYLIICMLYLIIFGFFFKLAAFPCHLWAPDIYDGSPTLLLSIFVLPIKIGVFTLFLRIVGHTFADLYEYWYYIFWFSASFSMLWGSFGAIIDQNIKKFLAYSSINQMGFLLMGITCGTFEGFRAAIIYLMLYIIMNIGFFLIYLTTNTNNKTAYKLDSFWKYNLKHVVKHDLANVLVEQNLAGLFADIEEEFTEEDVMDFILWFEDYYWVDDMFQRENFNKKTTNEYNLLLDHNLIYITDFNLFAKYNFHYSISLVIILFSMAGIPPLGGFFGKYFIFLSCFETGNIGLIVIGMFTSVLGAYYYLRIVKIMLFETSIWEKTYLDFFQTKLSQIQEKFLFLIEFFLIFFMVFLNLFLVSMNFLTIIALNPLALW